jgi:hypothetical protein
MYLNFYKWSLTKMMWSLFIGTRNISFYNISFLIVSQTCPKILPLSLTCKSIQITLNKLQDFHVQKRIN